MRSGNVLTVWLVVILVPMIFAVLGFGGVAFLGRHPKLAPVTASVEARASVKPIALPEPPKKPAAAEDPTTKTDEMAMFRGDPERNQSGVGTMPRHPKLLWRFLTKTKLEGPYEKRDGARLPADHRWRGLGWTGQPCMVGGRLYFGSADSYVYCLAPKTGKVLWYYPNHHAIRGSISVAGGYVYHGGRDNKIHCYRASDGKMVWETRISEDIDSSPVVIGNRGFIGAEDHRIYCFSPTTGKILWRSQRTLGSVESSPTVVGNHVIAGSDDGILYCCDAGTGKTVWTDKTGGATVSTAAYSGGRLYVGAETGEGDRSGFLWCINEADGKPVWHLTFSRGIWATPALDPATGRLYVGCNNGMLYCLRMADGKLVWKRLLGNRIWSSAAVTGGCVVVGVRNGQVWCLDADTGNPMWVFNAGYDIDATPCVCDGLIVIGSQNGWVYCIGEAGPKDKLDTHWFTTTFPLKKWPKPSSAGIVTVKSPAPAPHTPSDTSASCTAHLRQPVYGPAYAKRKTAASVKLAARSRAATKTKATPARAPRLVGGGPAPPPPGVMPRAPEASQPLILPQQAQKPDQGA